MDVVLKLREIRRMRGLSQKDVARLSGVGEKTISSFETGERIGSLKLAQLTRLLGVYGLTEAEFFGGKIEREIAPWELDEEQSEVMRLVDELHTLPKPAQHRLLEKFHLMAETAAGVYGERTGDLSETPHAAFPASRAGVRAAPATKDR